MKKVIGETWRIENQDDLYKNTDVASSIIEFAENEGRKDEVRWFFKEGYANFSEGKITGLFSSYVTPEHKGYLLSVEAERTNKGRWRCRILKKEIPNQHNKPN
jgi:hypothetical protein